MLPPGTPLSANPTVLSVSQLNRRARQLLELHLNQVWVEGELSNLSIPSSGHWYFTLKDAQAQVRCAMFKPLNGRVGFRPKEGALLRVRARVSLYEGRGDFQLIVEHMEDSGLGALQKAFELLKKKLADEGLFDPVFKQALPACPSQIGVVTSASGAALHDILTVLKRRYPLATVTLFPVAVQGKGAAEEIARAIQLANHNELLRPEVLIVGRGGGSLEDLWAFNEEIVARAIFASEIPVVSAVGHEIDFCIADFVADVRAATPSAAAELVTPDIRKLQQAFADGLQQLQRLLLQQLREQQQHLRLLGTRLKHPGQNLQERSQHLDHLEIRLQQALANNIQRSGRQCEQLAARLQQQSPQEKMRWWQLRLQQLQQQATRYMDNQLQMQQRKVAGISQLLHGLSPLNTLNRGYAIARDPQQHVIQGSDQVRPGDRISVQLKQGLLTCQVLETK